MPAPLSIIIPTLNAAPQLRHLLPDLMAGVQSGLICEVILADGGSTDDTAAMADATGAELATASPGRGTQQAHGADLAKGDWLLFLHADSHLPENWPELVANHMASHPTKAAYFLLKFDSSHPMARVTAAWANLRSRLFGLAYGDQGLLIPAALYRRAGGHPDIPLMEDVALARKLKGQMRPIAGVIQTGADKYADRGWVRHGAGNILRLLRYLAGTSPERLAKDYASRPSSNCKR